MVFVRLLAHINHNWGLLIFQRPFSFFTGMLIKKLNLVEVSAEQSISNKGEQTFSAAIAQGFPAR
jgi:hypothetical protein